MTRALQRTTRAQIAVNALKTISQAYPYVRGAKVLGQVAQAGYNHTKAVVNAYQTRSKTAAKARQISNRRVTKTATGRSTTSARMGSGQYVGKFKKATKKKDTWSTHLSKGFCNVDEINGTVSDANCVYVGHSTVSSVQTFELVSQVILRKVFEKVGRLNIVDVKRHLLGFQGFATGYRLELVFVNTVTGAITSTSYDTIATESIYTILGDNANAVAANWPGWANLWLPYIRGSGGANPPTSIPTELRLYRQENISGASSYLGAGSIDLGNEKIHYKSVSAIKIQNRTQTGSGSSEAEAVDSNPLIGIHYTFKSAAPIIKALGAVSQNRSYLFTSIGSGNACMVARGGQFPVGSVFNEPIEPRSFTNLKGSNKVQLNPGNIKSSKLYYSVTMSLNRFMKSLNDEVDGGKTINVPGSFEMYALEDIINIDSSVNIKIAYEVNRKMGCSLTTHKRTIAQGLFTQQSLSENPP